MPGYVRLVALQRASGTLLNTYTTAKSVINPQALYTFPANSLEPGDYLRIRAAGGISNVVTSQRTFTFQIMMGSIVVHASQALLTTTTVHTLIPFEYEAYMRLDTEGSGTTAKFFTQARLHGIMFPISGAVGDPTATIGTIHAPATAPAAGTGFDSTVSNILDFWVGLSASEAGTGIQVYQYTAEWLTDRN